MTPGAAPLAVVADDDLDIRALVERHLRTLGFEIVLAADGEQALELASLHAPDLVTLDVRMPRRSGFEVTGELRRRGLGVPILLLSASVQPDDVAEGFEAGADAYLKKPFTRADFMRKVIDLMAVKERP